MLARLHRTALDHLGVRGQPKVTGRRGIQIWIPVSPGPDFAETRAWTEKLSRTIGAVVPDLVSWKWQVSERSGLARLDYTQNAINKTLVAPYSPRPAPGAPVSAPIEWDELDDPALAPTGSPSARSSRASPRRATFSYRCWRATSGCLRSAESDEWLATNDGRGQQPEPLPGVVSTPQPVIRLTGASLGCLMLSAAESGPCFKLSTSIRALSMRGGDR